MGFGIRIRLAAVAVLVTGISTACGASSVRRPLWRTEEYRRAIGEYAAAAVVPSAEDRDGYRVWEHLLSAGLPVNVTVTGRAHMERVYVSYEDESEPRPVYLPEDYTTNLQVRVIASRLYVYRVVSLLWTEHRLALYELAERRRVMDILVAPEDMPQEVARLSVQP